jgi:hypothetical protein
MAKRKTSKPHSSARKKPAMRAAKSIRTKKAASKRSQTATKFKKPKKSTERPAWLKKRDELTLKMFQMVYDDYQQGKFRRIQ